MNTKKNLFVFVFLVIILTACASPNPNAVWTESSELEEVKATPEFVLTPGVIPTCSSGNNPGICIVSTGTGTQAVEMQVVIQTPTPEEIGRVPEGHAVAVIEDYNDEKYYRITSISSADFLEYEYLSCETDGCRATFYGIEGYGGCRAVESKDDSKMVDLDECEAFFDGSKPEKMTILPSVMYIHYIQSEAEVSCIFSGENVVFVKFYNETITFTLDESKDYATGFSTISTRFNEDFQFFPNMTIRIYTVKGYVTVTNCNNEKIVVE